MNGFDFLNLVIGLIFIYLIFSIASSTIWEIVVSTTNLKSKMLIKWIYNQFSELTSNNGKEKKSEIIEHPLIKGLSIKTGKIPNYISSPIFTDVLIDLIVNKDAKGDNNTPVIVDINSLKSCLENTNVLNPGLKRIFLQYISEASGNLQKVKDKIGRWYDETQERLIGSYKKNLQIWIFVIASILVAATNADTIKLATYLYNNPDVSEKIANHVDTIISDSSFIKGVTKIDTSIIDTIAQKDQKEIITKIEGSLKSLEELNKELSRLEIPIGWGKENFNSFWDYVKKIGGLLLTIFAVSLGSPFWFDVLSKLANLRSSGNKPKSLLEEQAKT